MYFHRRLSMFAAGVMVAALPALVSAATEQEVQKGESGSPVMYEHTAKGMTGQYTPALRKVNALIGTEVRNSKGESLGEIEDVVLNSNRDRVAYYIIARGGVLGMGEKCTAVPWSCIELRKEGEAPILNIDKTRFEQARTFEEGKWPDMSDPQWSHDVYQFFTSGGHMEKGAEHHGKEQMKGESKGMGERGSAYRMTHFWGVRHSRLIGTDVKNRQGEDLGEIEEIMVDTHKGDLAYAILAFGGVLGVGEKYAPVPWSALQLRPAQRTCWLNTDKATLEAIAFKSGQWPDLGNATYARDLYARFDREPYWEVFGYVGAERAERTEQAWLSGSEYNKHFDANSMKSIEGTVESVGTFRPERNAFDGLRLRVKTQEGNTLTVYAGPEAYASKHGWTFHYGDQVKVHGSTTTFQNRSVLIASEIERQGKKLELRDKQGQPKWTAEDLRSQ